RVTKYEAQLLVVGVFLYLLNAQGDPVGLMMDGDKALFLEPRKTSEGVAQMVFQLSSSKPSHPSSLLTSLSSLRNRLRKPSVIWICSDFDNDPELLLEKIKSCRNDGHDVRVLHFFHPHERDMPWEGECEFEDMEEAFSGIKVHPADLRAQYHQEYLSHQKLIKSRLIQMGIPYYLYDITQPVEQIVIDIFQSQS
ncbi:MAG: hypothetical protein HQL32_06910, partial [Planctomycetes bacterium]|nr:hypothetical protein [Planctomycetota bacterium]